MTPERITREQFDAFDPMRNEDLMAMGIIEEREWYRDETGNLIGVLVADQIDGDWGYVVLGRDERGRFRAVEQGSSIGSSDGARTKLLEVLRQLETTGQAVFPQSD